MLLAWHFVCFFPPPCEMAFLTLLLTPGFTQTHIAVARLFALLQS